MSKSWHKRRGNDFDSDYEERHELYKRHGMKNNQEIVERNRRRKQGDLPSEAQDDYRYND